MTRDISGTLAQAERSLKTLRDAKAAANNPGLSIKKGRYGYFLKVGLLCSRAGLEYKEEEVSDKVLKTCRKEGFITPQEVTLIGCTVREAIMNRSNTSKKQRKRLISGKYAHCCVNEFLERQNNMISSHVSRYVDSEVCIIQFFHNGMHFLHMCQMLIQKTVL